MDEFIQAAKDGDVNILKQYVEGGRGDVREAFFEALRSKALPSIDYLLPYMGASDLRRIAGEAKERRDEVIYRRVSEHLAKSLSKSKSPPLQFDTCLMPRSQFLEYTIGSELLGEGAYGQVFAGEHRPSQTPVAIKAMYKAFIETSGLNLIQHECQILAQLDHPHIIKIFGGYEDDDAFFWILTLMRGGTLTDYIFRTGYFTESASLNIFRQLVAAVAYCHQKNIVHRDIKPDNILIYDSTVETDQLLVALSDFGFATIQLPGQYFTDHIGTPNYSAPEIFAGVPYDGRAADVWALGITFYIIHFGKLPFSEPNLAHKITYSEPIYTNDMISDFIRFLLQKDPQQRPPIEILAQFLGL